MSHTAQTTYYGLPIYEDKAGNQPTYLGDWNDTMRSIDSSLNAVAAQSSGVVSTANQALTTAQQAQQTANAANSVANSAQQTANGLSDAVETAQQTAEAANTAAGTAQSTAESANSTAQQASTTASNALSQAQTAVSTAGTAQSTATSAQQSATEATSKLSRISKISLISKVFPSGASAWFDFTGTEIAQALDLSSPDASGVLSVFACNGDSSANNNVPIRSVAINSQNWNVTVHVDSAVSGAARINLGLIYFSS